MPAPATLSPPAIAPPAFEFIGRHLMASYIGCDARALRDLDALEDALKQAVSASGATLLTSCAWLAYFLPMG